MGNNTINGLFDALTPSAEQKEKMFHKIVSFRQNKYRSKWNYTIITYAVLCIAMVLSMIAFLGDPPSFAVYAYGSDMEITGETAEISTGTINDSGEMKGQLLQLYIVGEKIDSITFSCKNQYLEFNDWTEKQSFVGRAKSIVVSYNDIPSSEYYYLRINWIPWDTQRVLVENEEIGIADLSSSLREDMIQLEVTFENGSSTRKFIYIYLDHAGVVAAMLTDDPTLSLVNESDKDTIGSSNILDITPISPQYAEPEPTENAIISTEEEDTAREAAINYYEGTTFADRISVLSRIEDRSKYEDYIPENTNGSFIVFDVFISGNYDIPRIIVLEKNSDGEWEVINEGY